MATHPPCNGMSLDSLLCAPKDTPLATGQKAAPTADVHILINCGSAAGGVASSACVWRVGGLQKTHPEILLPRRWALHRL